VSSIIASATTTANPIMPAMYVDLDEWLKVTSSWRMRSRSPSPHNILIRPASSSHIVPNRSITAGQKSEDTPAANGPYFCVFCRARRAAATPHEAAEEGRASSAPPDAASVTATSRNKCRPMPWCPGTTKSARRARVEPAVERQLPQTSGLLPVRRHGTAAPYAE